MLRIPFPQQKRGGLRILTKWQRVSTWAGAVFARSRLEREMDAEMRFHMDAYTQDLVRGGMGQAEALRRARIEFGGVEQKKEECRDA